MPNTKPKARKGGNSRHTSSPPYKRVPATRKKVKVQPFKPTQGIVKNVNVHFPEFDEREPGSNKLVEQCIVLMERFVHSEELPDVINGAVRHGGRLYIGQATRQKDGSYVFTADTSYLIPNNPKA